MYTGYRDCCYQVCAPPCFVYVPVVWVPNPCCEPVTIPRDLTADAKNQSATGLAGGSEQVSLSLEYLVESGAASPSVKLTLTSPDGTTSDWSDTSPSVGYHVQEGLLSAKAGTKLSLTVNNVTARLRWCER